MPDQEPKSRLRWALTNGAHLIVLSSFALAQPLLDILGRNAAFFAVRGSSSSQIVLFALALVFVLPAALLAIELIALFINRSLANAVHLFFICILSAVVALYFFTKTDSLSGTASLVSALCVGAVAAALYWRTGPLRSFLSVLSPAPLVFLALFLFSSQASDLVFPSTPKASAATVVKAKTPVVLIVFDELNSSSFMNAEGKIEAVRYPNFASLAGNATWYRNATTVHRATEGAVPAIVTGDLPTENKLPTVADYPNTLFTMLGKSYQMKVFEPLHLCAKSLCPKTSAQDEEASPSTSSLLSDTGIVYLHLLLPEPYIGHVAPISDTWGNFGKHDTQITQPARQKQSSDLTACLRGACKLANSITDSKKPTLYYMHAILPHVPYVTLPSGRLYNVVDPDLATAPNGRWLADWAARQTEERYLLQVGYTDRALGVVLKRLRETGIYDKALVIVTADHGCSYHTGGNLRRLPTSTNLDDIAFIPLFVKLPGQTKGKIDDSFVRSIDILPTIARVLHTKARWHVDGKPLVGRRLPANGTVSVQSGPTWVSMPLHALRIQRLQTLKLKAETFGSGSFSSIYRVGPHRSLLGRNVSALSVRTSSTNGAKLANPSRSDLKAVDPSALVVPVFFQGTISGQHTSQLDLAIALNGKIQAVTQTYSQDDATRFEAMVPETALQSGTNSVTVYAVNSSGHALKLTKLNLGWS
jgi:Arylsulfatase A and related enzymes